NVDLAEAAVGRLRESLAVVPVAHVATKAERLSPGACGDFARQRCARVAFSAGNHDVRPVLRERDRDLAAEAATATRNDGHPAAQIEFPIHRRACIIVDLRRPRWSWTGSQAARSSSVSTAPPRARRIR